MKVVVTILFFMTFISLACQSEKRIDKTQNMSSNFTYEVELAGYEFGQKDELGEIDYEKFIKSFDEFPWIKQIEIANQAQGVSPTLSVKDNQKDEIFWVSGAGDKNNYGYLIGHIYQKEVSTFFGFGKPKLKKWLEIYLTDDKVIIKECFKLFFERKTEELRNKYSRLEKYGEMEPVN